jgi:hypothetical protein
MTAWREAQIAQGTVFVDLPGYEERIGVPSLVPRGQSRRFATVLTGSTGVGVVVELPNGDRLVLMAHLLSSREDPERRTGHARMVSEMVERLTRQEVRQSQAIIMASTIFGKPLDEDTVYALQRDLFLCIPRLRLHIATYGTNRAADIDLEGTLILDLAADGGTQFQVEGTRVEPASLSVPQPDIELPL